MSALREEYSPVNEVKNQAPDVDWLLQQLVEYTNQFGLEIDVSLQVSGMLVSGRIISGSDYFDLIADGFGAAFSRNEVLKEQSDSMKNLFKAYKAIYKRPSDGEPEKAPPTFIHLRDVKFVTPGQVALPNDGNSLLWRGRISEVAGFTFSRFL